ncbi:uncharacterized protein [Porites lutea]|uniref:uncharacterized protein n=1 Tax=Porites lutea TaxID=51062 RepID=UPI003CC5F54A
MKTASLRSFHGIKDHFRTKISLEEGKIGIMKFWDAGFSYTIRLGVGYDDSEYIDISSFFPYPWMADPLLPAFKQSGFANQILGKYKLLPCSLGWFVNASSEAKKCIECPAGGFYSDQLAFVNDSCLHCKNGTFVHYNNAPGKSPFDCKTCPDGTETYEFAGFRACKCLDNYYRTNLFGNCTLCEKNGGLKCLDDFANLTAGFWWKWKHQTHLEVYRNFIKNVTNFSFTPELHKANDSGIEYPYTIPQPYRCPIAEACKGGLNSSCEAGYEGPLCAVCSDGYYKKLKKCKLCPTRGWMIGQLVIIGALIILLVILVVWRSKKKNKKDAGRSFLDKVLGEIKIVIGFYQVLFGIMEAFSYIKWPGSLSVIGEYSDIFQMNILQIAPLHCIFPHLEFDALTSLFAVMGLNIAAVIVALASLALATWISTRHMSNEEEKMKTKERIKAIVKRNLFFFLFVTYLNTCLKTAQVLPLACHRLCVDPKKDESCEEYLKADYSINCKGERYKRNLEKEKS